MISVTKRHYISAVFVTSFFLALLWVVFFVLSFKDALGSDFVSFLTGAEILKRGQGEHLYDFYTQYQSQQYVIRPIKEESILPYLNIPVFAFLLIPLTYLSLLKAYKLYMLFLIVVLFLVLFNAKKIFKNLSSSYWLLLPFIFYPTIGSVFVGQITPIIILVFLLIYKSIKEKKYLISGVLSSLLLFKFQYVIFIAYLLVLIKVKKEYLTGLFIGTTTIILASVLLTDGTFIIKYLEFVLFTQKPVFGIRAEDMFTLHASLSQLTNLSYIPLLLINFVFFLTSIGIYWLKFKDLSLDITFSVAIIFTLVFCVHGVNYDYGLTIIPLFILLNRLKGKLGLMKREKVALFIFLLAPLFFAFYISFYVSLLLIVAPFLLIGNKKPSITKIMER